ncbi:MAG: hypothetical protein AB8C84_03855 [Oligoflexales bacterium]
MTHVFLLLITILSTHASAAPMAESFPVDGPNCYNTALRLHGLIEEDRYVGYSECKAFLNKFFTEQSAAQESQDLDIIAYGDLAHVIVQTSQNNFFHKLGVAKEYKREALEKDKMNQLLIKSKISLWPKKIYRYNGNQEHLYSNQEKKWLKAFASLFITPKFFNQAHLAIRTREILDSLKKKSKSQFFHHALDSFYELTTRMIENAEHKKYANPFLCTTLKPLSEDQKQSLNHQIDAISLHPTAEALFDILK